MARERLAAKTLYSTIAFQLMPETFTLSELQTVYEILRDEKLDKRNFRKWVLGLNRCVETGGKRRNGNHRPAKIYRLITPHLVENLR